MSNILQTALNFLGLIGLLIISFSPFAILIALSVRDGRKRKKRDAICIYANRGGRLLYARCGQQNDYTPAQVKKMMKEWGYSTEYDCYGLAMYCRKHAFLGYHQEMGQPCDYATMRREISHCLFQSDIEFMIADVMMASVPSHPHRGDSSSHSRDISDYCGYVYDDDGYDGDSDFGEFD